MNQWNFGEDNPPIPSPSFSRSIADGCILVFRSTLLQPSPLSSEFDIFHASTLSRYVEFIRWHRNSSSFWDKITLVTILVFGWPLHCLLWCKFSQLFNDWRNVLFLVHNMMLLLRELQTFLCTWNVITFGTDIHNRFSGVKNKSFPLQFCPRNWVKGVYNCKVKNEV